MEEKEDDQNLKAPDQKQVFEKLLTFRKYFVQLCIYEIFNNYHQGNKTKVTISESEGGMGKEEKIQWSGKY